jgi:hypothetical protein
MIYNDKKIGKENIMNILLDFSCTDNKEVEDFIHEKAYDFERVGLSRTYLVYAYPFKDKSPVLVAIYSLGQSNVIIDDNLTSKMKKKIFGTTYPIGKKYKIVFNWAIIKELYK